MPDDICERTTLWVRYLFGEGADFIFKMQSTVVPLKHVAAIELFSAWSKCTVFTVKEQWAGEPRSSVPLCNVEQPGMLCLHSGPRGRDLQEGAIQVGSGWGGKEGGEQATFVTLVQFDCQRKQNLLSSWPLHWLWTVQAEFSWAEPIPLLGIRLVPKPHPSTKPVSQKHWERLLTSSLTLRLWR